jgi:ABC-2 type transport system permease protein
VADVAQLPGVLAQLRLIAGLRWTLLRNGLQRKNNRWDLVGIILAGVFAGILVVGLSAAFCAGAYAVLTRNHAGWMALLFWAIFLWWQVFPIFVAGFGANFEFKTLLRFPLSRRTFYLLGLGYGFADFAAVAAVCWVAAMNLGAAMARPEVLPVMLAVSVLFVLMNVTLERLIGSWLERIMAKRKTRELFIGLFVLSMVSLNFLNPMMQRYGMAARPKVLHYLPYLAWLPGSLAGKAVAGTVNGDLRAILLGVAGLVLWLGVTSGFLWQRFAAQYSGEEISESAAPAPAKKKSNGAAASAEASRAGISNEEWLPMVPVTVAAVALKEFRYMTRNGMAFLTLFLPPIMVVFFTMQFGKGSALREHAFNSEKFFPGIMAYLILILIMPAYNSFAFEGKGIQTYFMAPLRFQDVLMGKNLFLGTLVSFELGLSLALLVWRVGWPSPAMFATTIAGGAFAVLGQLTIANWSSLSFPKKMEIGKMKGQRNSGVAVWTAFGVQIVLGGVCALIILVGRWMSEPWMPAVAFMGLTAAAAGGYVASLSALSRLAEAKKELLIETLSK